MNHCMRSALLLALVLLVACETPLPEEAVADPQGPADSYPRYIREMVFVGRAEGEPLLVPFSFEAIDRGSDVGRQARGWVAHGESWEMFLDEEWEAGPTGSVWRLVPVGPLRVLVGGAAEIEALSYRREGDELRLAVRGTQLSWQRVGSSRFRILGGTLRHRDREVEGVIVEAQHLRSPSAEQTEPPALVDWSYLTDRTGEHQLLLVTPSRDDEGRYGTLAWARDEEGRQSSDWLNVTWTEVLTVEAARREVPMAWRYDAPELHLTADIRHVGHHVDVGAERRGRRVVSVRYTVRGTLNTPEGETEVFGIARHDRE